MFFRRIEHELMQWAERAERKPLVLRGARQVGKTTVVNKFGRQFENYLYVNLEKENSKQLIESTDDVKKLLPLIFLYCNKTRKSGRTLLFIDEIQESPHALNLLRYFYEDTPEILVIAAGSLLETMLEKNISIPVGRVEYMAVHPCSFNEFLSATGNSRYVEPIINADLHGAFHEELLQNFNLYALIGGMPEVVARYAAGKDIVALSRIYNQLLTGFKNDVEKYAESNSQTAVIRYILDEGWAFSGETITLGGFASSSYKARETGEALRILQKAMLLELVYPTTNMVLPAITDLKKSPKLFWLDSGLVNYISGIQKEYLLNKDLLDTWRGKAAEQIVAQELKALSFETELKQKFWVRNKRGSTAEVDFVYVHDGKIIPIEVKSGHNAHLKSIHQFMNETHHDIAFRIWSGRYSVDNVKTTAGKNFRLINLPFYMISALPNILRR
ncbi:MAG: AAA family ATPase [Bacteroidales bacterium]|nr:AAA family ATPase [Bacteroidales bacterium]